MQSNLSADTDSKRPEADAPATRAALEKILSSVDFARSKRLSTLLDYLVRETLEGRGERIKAKLLQWAVASDGKHVGVHLVGWRERSLGLS